MKKNSILSGLAVMAILGFTSCMQNDFNLAEGEGTLHIRTSLNDDVTVVSRGSSTQEELEESLQLWVCKNNTKGDVVREYKGLYTVPNDIKLVAGSYFVEGWAGDSVGASFVDKYYYGRSEAFTVTNNQATNVNLTCKIQNVVVSVNFDKSVLEVLKDDYTFTIGHKFGSLTFDASTEGKGYFMMSSQDKDLAWTLEGTTYDDKPYSRTGKIENAKKTTEYAIAITYNYETSSELGGGYLDINIDNTPIKPSEDDNFELALAPTIMGLGTTDLSKTISGEPAEVGLQAFLIAGAHPLTEAVISSAELCKLLGHSEITEMDFLNMTDAFRQELDKKGLSFLVVDWEDPTTLQGPLSIQVVLSAEFIATWSYGDYEIKIKAKDTTGKSSSATLNILLTQAKVEAQQPDIVMQWGAPYVLLNGRKIKEATTYGIVYSINGGAEKYEETALSGDKFSLKIEGLIPGDQISYKAVCDYNTADQFIAVNSVNAAMPQGVQMPNNSFEKWIEEMPILPTDSKTNQFWDTGNHGSALTGVNLTNPCDTYKHSGNFSASLQSQKATFMGIGKFAAGNIFVGEYIKTDGTDGILGFGKKLDFNYKPKALSFWVRYEPKTIDNVGKNLPDGVNISKGDPDQGIVYFALLSNSEDQTEDGKTYPVIIKTKATNRQLFNKDAGNIIAYGEYIFTTATEGSGMVNIVVPFDYKQDIKPTYIMCTFAASRYGDYFSGGPSTMYVDDVELVY